MKSFYWLLILLLRSVGQIESGQAAPVSPSGAEQRFPKPVEEYHDEQIPGITAKLAYRIQAEPFNLVATLIFLGAIVHTFLASKFIPLAIAILVMKGWSTLTSYAAAIDAAEPIFVVVVMAMASSRPILHFAEACLAKVASLGRSTIAAWWLAILTVGPVLGSLSRNPRP